MKAFERKREIPTFKWPKDSAYVKLYFFFFLFHGPCQQLRFWVISCDIGQIQFSSSFAWSNCLACRLNKWLIFYHTKCVGNFLSSLNLKITSQDRYFPRKWRKLRQRFVLESAAILLATLVTNLQTVMLANVKTNKSARTCTCITLCLYCLFTEQCLISHFMEGVTMARNKESDVLGSVYFGGLVGNNTH